MLKERKRLMNSIKLCVTSRRNLTAKYNLRGEK